MDIRYPERIRMIVEKYKIYKPGTIMYYNTDAGKRFEFLILNFSKYASWDNRTPLYDIVAMENLNFLSDCSFGNNSYKVLYESD